MRRSLFPLMVLSLAGFLGFLAVYQTHRIRAQTGQTKASVCCGPESQRELDFPYYSLAGGFSSALNLVSDSPNPLDFTLVIHGRSGLTQVMAKMGIDLRSLLTSLNADVTGDFAEGSIAALFEGTIMPLVGQVTITNPALGLVHESEMVENDPGRSDIPAALSGLWWSLSGGRDARIMVSNMSGNPAVADVFLDFQGERHPSAPLTFSPHETKVLSVAQLLGDLKTSPSQAPEGGITIIQRGPNPRLIAQGKVLDPVTGFSTTLEFPDPARQRTNALHASGVPIGTPPKGSPFAGTGSFAPQVIARNLGATPQALTITVEYPKGAAWNSVEGPGGPAVPSVVAPVLHHKDDTSSTAIAPPPSPDPASLTGQLALAPLTLGPYSTADFSLDAVMNQLPLPLPYCSIRIQYSGAPGTMAAQVSSVDVRQDLVVDARVMNEGDGWAGSGANPWHLDTNTESILFLTDESDKPARIGFSITAGGVHYYLTTLKLAPHETRAINIRQLRDAQQADFKNNKFPAGAADGAVNWVRLDNVAVTGRVVVISRSGGIASSYDCSYCTCPSGFDSVVAVSPTSFDLLPGDWMGCTCTAEYKDCNSVFTYVNVTASATWSSSNTSIATVSGNVVTGLAGGTATISANWTDCGVWAFVMPSCECTSQASGSGGAAAYVCDFTIQGAPPLSVCDGKTKNLATFQAVISACSVNNPGSNLTFSTDGVKVTPDYNDSSQSYRPPTLKAYYWATSSGGTITPKFTIQWYPSLKTTYHEVTRTVNCQ